MELATLPTAPTLSAAEIKWQKASRSVFQKLDSTSEFGVLAQAARPLKNLLAPAHAIDP